MIFGIFGFFLVPLNCLSALVDSETKKIQYVYSLVNFVDWPETAFAAEDSDFKICVYQPGDESISLTEKAFPQKMMGYPIQWKPHRSTSVPTDCHLFYLSSSYADVKGLSNFSTGRHTLTVSDLPGFATKGGMIEIGLLDSGVHLSINQEAVVKAGLTIRSNLLQISTIVAPIASGENIVSTNAPTVGLDSSNKIAVVRQNNVPPPEPVKRVSPIYPKRALHRKIEGFVKAKMKVDADGNVSNVEVVKAYPGTVFNKAAINALRNWKFEPLSNPDREPERNVVQLIAFELKK